jgi:pimeloyl-ACP methyl ester carboxylesterase
MVTEWLLTNVIDDDGVYRWRFDRAALAALEAQISGEDLWAVVEGEAVRAAMIRGGDSGRAGAGADGHAIPSFVSDDDVERFERARHPVRTIEGAGHFLHIDRPDAVLRALAELRAELDR